jgi:DNA replication and repair protein RecF
MALTRLSLTDFRNHQAAFLMPGMNFVVLTGDNGAGKTNILEAVSLLVPGRGLRAAALAEMARSAGPGGFAVAARMGDVDLGVGTLATAPERRVVRINGAAASAGSLSEWLSIVWLTPAMDRLFMEGASERRRFLDRLVLALEPVHAQHTTRYDAAMRQRNRLLGGESPADPDWLGALESQMAEHGSAVARARYDLLTLLNERMAASTDGPFARAALALAGWQDEGKLVDELAQGRSRDSAAGRTLAGPHRSDLAVEHLGKGQPAARCSTGEQKALLLGIVLAHADLVAEQVGRRPILLLDEIAAHLDPVRRAALFEKLASGGGQVWMTGTEADLFDGLGQTASWFRVDDGTVLPSEASRPST